MAGKTLDDLMWEKKTWEFDFLLQGAGVHLASTDPPYNVRVEPRSNNAIALANGFLSDGEFDRLLRSWFGNISRVLLPGRGPLPFRRLRQHCQLPIGAESFQVRHVGARIAPSPLRS
jgi:hypothetical protein